MQRVKKKYLEEVRPTLKERFKYSSIMQVPKIEKIVLNMGLGDAIKEAKILDAAVEELGLMAGQKPAIAKAKKSVSNFKLRQGMKIGAYVTLRGEKMYEFYERLVSIVVPRIRDFSGMPKKSFDGRGSYNFGIKEQTVFPEIKFDSVIKANGLNVTIVTSAKTDEEAYELLKELNFPFKKNKVEETAHGKEINDSQG
ncbi:MAG: 50S ribosomal protein L5 [Candidatus Cloacimonadota bacterium]|nr:MAG: 50S ribosomal protein L5 [Candidatus Cloacimonadota bacterium]PIE79132.1 MAG: 50S ribosomal protein L5 [Candidatus Delongbacteria bacterium]